MLLRVLDSRFEKLLFEKSDESMASLGEWGWEGAGCCLQECGSCTAILDVHTTWGAFYGFSCEEGQGQDADFASPTS